VLAGVSHFASLQEIERGHISRVLSESATLDEAAATLGVNGTTLWRKRKRYVSSSSADSICGPSTKHLHSRNERFIPIISVLADR
jgi:hypothetical protein